MHRLKSFRMFCENHCSSKARSVILSVVIEVCFAKLSFASFVIVPTEQNTWVNGGRYRPMRTEKPM